MNAAVRTLVDELLQRPGTSLVAGDMLGEQSLRVDGREVLHVHGAAVLHITLPREVKEEVLAAGLARQHPFAPRSGAVQLALTGEEGLPAARRLAARAFDYAVSRGQRVRPAPPAGSVPAPPGEERTGARPG